LVQKGRAFWKTSDRMVSPFGEKESRRGIDSITSVLSFRVVTHRSSSMEKRRDCHSKGKQGETPEPV